MFISYFGQGGHIVDTGEQRKGGDSFDGTESNKHPLL